MVDHLILALDQGTGSCRSFVINAKGEVVCRSQKEIKQIYPNQSWVEQDPNEIWKTQKLTIDDCLQQLGESKTKIKVVGITNQRESIVVWDRKSGKAIYNSIIWQDKRTEEYCNTLKKTHGDLVFKKTGLIIDTYFSASKIKWILDNDIENRIKAEKGELCAGTMDTWLIWNLSEGNNFFTDASNASRTMLYNIHSNEWDEELLNLFDIPKGILPEVLDSDADFGLTHNLSIEIPIRAVLGDQQSALFGQQCFDPGSVKCTFGTGAFILSNIGNKPVLSQNSILTTIAWRINKQNTYAFEGSIFIAGAVVKWLRDQVRLIDSIDEVESLALQSTDQNLYFVPAFAGLGAPYWKMDAKGMITGITLDTNRNDIIKAALESIAFQSMELLKIIEDEVGELNEIYFDGGGSNNDFLMQFQSDILNKKIYRPKEVESTIMGVAFLAGLSCGIWNRKELEEIKPNLDVFVPAMDNDERTRRKNGWKNAIKMVLTNK